MNFQDIGRRTEDDGKEISGRLQVTEQQLCHTTACSSLRGLGENREEREHHQGAGGGNSEI